MEKGSLGHGEGTIWADRAPNRYREDATHGVKSPSAGEVLRTSGSPSLPTHT